jgi:intracellular septation protein
MKLLLDYLPLILFFGVFKLAGANPDVATAFANEHFHMLVSGGVIAAKQAPIMLATIATIFATFLQIGVLVALKKKVDNMLWATLFLVTVFGGATIYFNNEDFIKWKPTVLYWLFAAGLFVSIKFFKRNMTHTGLGNLFAGAPESLWRRMNTQWIFFFLALGALNLYVAFTFSLDDWVTFKLFGATALTFAMFVAQMVPLMKYMKEPE